VPSGAPPERIRSLCVYCGSSPGADRRHGQVARELGTLLAASGVQLVYGGASVGMMGSLADAALAGGGRVVGVLPRGLFRREVAHPGLTELHEVGSMHERKQLMFDLADAFVALPGGLGTLEELAEVATWAQLGIHSKPIAVLDPHGFWRLLLEFLDASVTEGFLSPRTRRLIVRVDRVGDLLAALDRYEAPPPEGALTAEEI
jgi:uncharacterized protein (TIGR00730 family)